MALQGEMNEETTKRKGLEKRVELGEAEAEVGGYYYWTGCTVYVCVPDRRMYATGIKRDASTR